MKWLLRPSSLMVLFAAVVAAGAFWVYESTKLPARPAPLPVEEGDIEVAWLNSATSAGSWQRFVEAIKTVPGIDADLGQAFPQLTTAVPQVAVTLPGGRGRLLFRWYKTTSKWKTDYWVRELVGREPPPLAIIGGNTTDVATDQATQLARTTAGLPEARRPLLLLTTATADNVPPQPAAGKSPDVIADGVPLMGLYPGRTFRFCFSDRQMAAAVIDFIWARDELRPTAAPVYKIVWKDDAYSSDLVDGFVKALQPFQERAAAAAAASDWGVAGGFAGAGGFPATGLTGINTLCRLHLLPRPTNEVPFSVGTFDRPNRYEAEVAAEVLDDLGTPPRTLRPLLLLGGQSQPSRRFVRALARLSPLKTRRFVAATGDAIPFNAVCRDRDVVWPVQDLPCNLVFFCHCDPVADRRFAEGQADVSGTEDLLLYADMVTALVRANGGSRGPCADADELRRRFRYLRLDDGRPALGSDGPKLFDEAGNRNGGTGEHVVWLKPSFRGERALPEATLTAFALDPGKGAWAPRCRPLHLTYTGARRD
jgi:hypothetical protein